MNRRDLLTSTGAGMALGFCAAVVAATPGCAPVEAPAAERINADLAAAIEAHRATIRQDEALYDDDCKPLVDGGALEASDAAIATALAAVAAAPCHTLEDVAAKARHFLNGTVGLRGNHWDGEFMVGLWPDNSTVTDPGGPLVAFLRSLLPEGRV